MKLVNDISIKDIRYLTKEIFPGLEQFEVNPNNIFISNPGVINIVIYKNWIELEVFNHYFFYSANFNDKVSLKEVMMKSKKYFEEFCSSKDYWSCG